MIPPGIDLSAITPTPPSDRVRPVIVHAPSSRRRKGTEHVIAACEGLDADLEIVEGLHHDEAFAALPRRGHRRRPAQCRLVRPVRDRVHGAREARRHVPARRGRAPDRGGLRHPGPDRLRDCRDAARAAARRSSPTRPSGAGSAPPRARTSSACTTSSGSPIACSPSTLDCDRWPSRSQLKRLGKHSVIYGLGGLVSRDPRRAPAAALHALPDAVRLRQGRDPRRRDGRAHDPAPLRHLERVLPLLLRLPRPGASRHRPAHLVLVHDDDGDRRARRGRPARARDLAPALRQRPRREPRAGGLRRALGADELRAADVAVPGRGALGRVRLRQPRQRR